MSNCDHFDSVDVKKFRNYEVCIGCVLASDTWVNLRTCQICGGTRCCDSSANKHATAHYKKTGHPVMYMVENRGLWCYMHEIGIKLES